MSATDATLLPPIAGSASSVGARGTGACERGIAPFFYRRTLAISLAGAIRGRGRYHRRPPDAANAWTSRTSDGDANLAVSADSAVRAGDDASGIAVPGDGDLALVAQARARALFRVNRVSAAVYQLW